MANKNKYTKEFLEPIIKESKYWGEVFNKLGIIQGGGNYKNIKDKTIKFNIDISHFLSTKQMYKLRVINKRLTYKDLFVINCKHNRQSVKRFIYDNKLKDIKCELCGQDENWKGKKMSLILDHINGIRNDNRIENLRLVCPNCNATLDTHCRGNKYTPLV